MSYYLRDKQNNTIVDLEIWNTGTIENPFHTDISCKVNIPNYSKKLLELHKTNQSEFIARIEELSELRGWLWEDYYSSGKNDGSDLADIIECVRDILKDAANRFNLHVVTD